LDIVRGWNWKSFTILYEDEEAMVRLQSLFKVSTTPGHKVMVRKLPQTDDYRYNKINFLAVLLAAT